MIILNSLKLLKELSTLEEQIAQQERQLKALGLWSESEDGKYLLKKLVDDKASHS